MALGAAGRRRLGAAAWALAALLAILAGAVAGILALARGSSGTLAGFPLAAVVQVVGLWLLPLPVATLAYALTFDRTGIDRRDLEELRARVRGGGGEPSGEPPSPA